MKRLRFLPIYFIHSFEVMSLPINSFLSDEEVQYVVSQVTLLNK